MKTDPITPASIEEYLAYIFGGELPNKDEEQEND